MVAPVTAEQRLRTTIAEMWVRRANMDGASPSTLERWLMQEPKLTPDHRAAIVRGYRAAWERRTR
jgi:hypothetical protein